VTFLRVTASVGVFVDFTVAGRLIVVIINDFDVRPTVLQHNYVLNTARRLPTVFMNCLFIRV